MNKKTTRLNGNRHQAPAAPLPTRNGVAPSRVYLPRGAWRTLLDFLHERYPHLPAGVLEDRLQRGDIVDERGVALTVDALYQAGQWLWYYREVPDEVAVPFTLDILFNDGSLVVADKPHFLATTPGGRYLQETALTRLRRMLDAPDLTPVHRLDRDTAGIVLFCIDSAHRGTYQTLFQRREIHKTYEAIAPWRSEQVLPCTHRSRIVPLGGGDFRMTQAEGEPNSETRIELITTLPGGRAHYRLLPLTGRKHQLRVHMSALGIPIENDEMYPDLLPQRAADDFSRPLQLLARSVWFQDPLSGKHYTFTSQRQLAGVTQRRDKQT